MSSTLLAHNPEIAQLQEEGYQLTLLPTHVVVHNIPYVSTEGTVAEGKFIIAISLSGETVTMSDHQIEFMGQFPCDSLGQPMKTVLSEVPTGNQILEGICSNYRFSNHPVDDPLNNSILAKLKHYESIITSEANILNPEATARVFAPSQHIKESIFKYPDTNAGRAGIVEQANRLRGYKLGIVGLGGTGSHILDLLAKTPVAEIHLYDGDIFENHNAFRSPGAAQLDELRRRPLKAEHFKSKYDAIRDGVSSHAYYIDESNLAELSQLDFVFISIDSGLARKIIADYLNQAGIPFIDSGIDISNRENNTLEASSRVTLVSGENTDAAMDMLSYGEIKGELYSSNVQIAEINSLNACHSIIEWKKFVGFYADDKANAFQSVYDSQDNRIIYS